MARRAATVLAALWCMEASCLAAEPVATEGGAVEVALSQAPIAAVSTFEEAIALAYLTNPAILAERATKRATDYRLPQATGEFLPRIAYEVGRDFRRDRVEREVNEFSVQSGWASTASLIANQPLLTFGRFSSATSEAKAQIRFQAKILEAAEQQLIVDVLLAYVSVIRDRRGLAIAIENKDLLTREKDEADARRTARELSVAEFRQVETRLNVALAEVDRARTRVESSEQVFVEIVGALPLDLAPPPEIPLPGVALAEAVHLGLENNPLVGAARERALISRASARRAASDRMPRVDLRGRVDLAPTTAYQNELRRRSVSGGIVLSGTFLDGGVLKARQRELEWLNEADRRLAISAERELTAELISSWQAFDANESAIAELQAAEAAAVAALEGAKVQQRAGLRSTLDVLILSRDLLSVRTQLNDAVSDRWILAARTLLAMGTVKPALLPEESVVLVQQAQGRVPGPVSPDILIAPLIEQLLSE